MLLGCLSMSKTDRGRAGGGWLRRMGASKLGIAAGIIACLAVAGIASSARVGASTSPNDPQFPARQPLGTDISCRSANSSRLASCPSQSSLLPEPVKAICHAVEESTGAAVFGLPAPAE